jgi:hypothetical protein
MTTINSFIKRLRKIGIEITLVENSPWVYIYSINGIRITERFQGNHGFTVFFRAIKQGQPDKITDITTIFKLIRKYVTIKN